MRSRSASFTSPARDLFFAAWPTSSPLRTSTCPGALWRLTPDCEAALDRYEGYRPGGGGMYEKEIVQVAGLPDGETDVMLYTMNSTGIFPPSVGYFNGIEEGYRDFGLKTAPLRLALKHSHDEKHPSHVERRRTRRTGRPALKARPQSKQEAAPGPRGVAAQKIQAEKERDARDRARKGNNGRVVYHDPWGAHVPAEKRRKNTNLADWIAERKSMGETV